MEGGGGLLYGFHIALQILAFLVKSIGCLLQACLSLLMTFQEVHSKSGLHLGISTYHHFYDAGLFISYCYAFIILHWKFCQTSYFA